MSSESARAGVGSYRDKDGIATLSGDIEPVGEVVCVGQCGRQTHDANASASLVPAHVVAARNNHLKMVTHRKVCQLRIVRTDKSV